MERIRLSILFFAFCFHINSSSAQDSIDAYFHPDSIRSIVEVLASDSLEGRFTGSFGGTMAEMFFPEEFKNAGLSTVAGNNRYFSPAYSGMNIVGVIPGRAKAEEIIIFSSHYDHIGTVSSPIYRVPGTLVSPESRDTIYNGANDNASGVAAVIMLARYFAEKNNNERTLVFVAFTGEEQGSKGSEFFADQCDPSSIKAVVNIEMIGRSHLSRDRPYMTGAHLTNLIDIMNEKLNEADRSGYGKKFIKEDPFSDEDLYKRSDNYSFAMRNMVAHTIMVSSPKDKYYHSVDDEVGTLDFRLMSKIIRLIAVGSSSLIDGTKTPK